CARSRSGPRCGAGRRAPDVKAPIRPWPIPTGRSRGAGSAGPASRPVVRRPRARRTDPRPKPGSPRAGPRRRSRLLRRLVASALVGSLLGIAATAPPAGASGGSRRAIPTVTIRARDFSFEMPAKIPSGWTTVRLVNEGGEPHQAQLAKLDPGVTPEQIVSAGASGGDRAIVALLTVAGGPNTTAAHGGTTSVTVNLTPGDYVAMCFIPSADGTRHYAKGMIQRFTVTKAPAQATAKAPKAKATITLSDFSFGFPS